MSISALPARSASARRIGSARALSAWVCGSSPVSATVSTPTSRPRRTLARTWMIENGVLRIGPSAVRLPGGGGTGVRAIAGGVACAALALTVRGGLVS